MYCVSRLNTDQGVQFTSAGFLEVLESRGIRISMDGKGRFLDNIFIARLWRSLKYEEVFIKAYGSVSEARRGIGGWLSFYRGAAAPGLGLPDAARGVRGRSLRGCGQRLGYD